MIISHITLAVQKLKARQHLHMAYMCLLAELTHLRPQFPVLFPSLLCNVTFTK